MTAWCKSDSGVRQGCPLSPLLFNIYVRELGMKLAQCKQGLKYLMVNKDGLTTKFHLVVRICLSIWKLVMIHGHISTLSTEVVTYLSNFLFHTVQCAYNIFNICISKHEPVYLRVENQKQTLLGLFEMYITRTTYFNSELLTCTECGSEIITQVMRALSCFANILLKNYSTTKSETVSNSNDSRKLSKF